MTGVRGYSERACPLTYSGGRGMTWLGNGRLWGLKLRRAVLIEWTQTSWRVGLFGIFTLCVILPDSFGQSSWDLILQASDAYSLGYLDKPGNDEKVHCPDKPPGNDGEAGEAARAMTEGSGDAESIDARLAKSSSTQGLAWRGRCGARMGTWGLVLRGELQAVGCIGAHNGRICIIKVV